MAEPTDEDLMRLADRQLDAAERAALLARIAENPEAQARAAIYEQGLRDLEDVRSVGNGAVPARLIEAIWNAPMAPRSPQAARARAPVAAHGWFARFVHAFTPQLATGLAAILAVGVMGGWGMARWAQRPLASPVQPVAERILAQGTLKRALETGLGGQTVAATAQEGITGATPGMTVRARAGSYCRHYYASGRDGVLSEGFACRDAAGEWVVTLHTPTIAAHSSGPAAGPSQRISDLVRETSIGDPLGREDVQEALERHWQPQP